MSQNFNGPVTVDGNEVATSATIERLIPDIVANTTGNGNAVTAISVDDSNKHKLNITKGSTFLTSHQSLTDLGITATAAELNVLDGITATTAELNYTDGVTSNIQTQLNAKQNALPTTTTAGKVLKSTSTAGTVEWGDVSGGDYLPLAGGTMTGSILSNSVDNDLGSLSNRWGNLYINEAVSFGVNSLSRIFDNGYASIR